MSKKKAESNRPIGRLGELLTKAGIQVQEPGRKSSPERRRISPPPDKKTGVSEEDVFTRAMEGVDRATWRHPLHPSSKPPKMPALDTERENRRLMQEVIDGHSPITIADHPEYIEGWIGVAGKRLLPKLRDGIYSIQGQIDLHGLDRAEAQSAVEEYIMKMSRFHSCCIKIIHGRGINSPADKATLKESLQRFLSTRKMSRYVVAYASAQSRDGGVGAVYVLLSRQ